MIKPSLYLLFFTMVFLGSYFISNWIGQASEVDFRHFYSILPPFKKIGAKIHVGWRMVLYGIVVCNVSAFDASAKRCSYFIRVVSHAK